MRVKPVEVFISLMALCLFSSVGFAGTYGGGSGDPNDPYLILDGDDFTQISVHPEDWDKHFILCSDIDLEGVSDCNRIGTGVSDNYFSGVFDGNDFSISNWSYETSESMDYLGIFGTVRGQNAEIKNLIIINPIIDAENAGEVAPLVGYLIQGKVTNCHVRGGSVKGHWLVGGLVGQNDYFSTDRGGIIEESSSSCRVEGTYTHQTFAGGLVGLNNGKISNCFAIGNVSGFVDVGGLVGKNHKSISPSESGNIDNSYALGNIIGEDAVGGLIGSNSYGDVSYCYSAGTVEGTTNKGGLIGEFFNTLGGSVTSCFWDFENSGLMISAAGTGLTTANMMAQTTYIAEGWDFTSPVWSINTTNSYPYLASENVSAGRYGGGSGSEDDPYRIFHGRHLDELGRNPVDWDNHFVLMKNVSLIDYPDAAFHIIGNPQVPFSGVLDGTGKEIGYFIYSVYNSNNHCGIFGCVEGINTQIQNVTMKWPNLWSFPDHSPQYVGSLVGYLKSGYVKNCHSIGGEVYSRYDGCGGLIGSNLDGTIIECTSNTYVRGSSGGYNLGGLVGYSEGVIQRCSSSGNLSPAISASGGLVGANKGLITESFSTSKITTSSYDNAIGGLVGRNINQGRVDQCYASGEVKGNTSIGGLVGYNDGYVTNSYATGKVTANNYAGGLIGKDAGDVTFCYAIGEVIGDGTSIGGLVGAKGTENSSIINSYWDINTTGRTYSYGGLGLTTAEMKAMISFKGFANSAWTINEGLDYPHLKWENEVGEIICACWYAGGTGSQEDPYLIQTTDQFCIIGQIPSDCNRHFLLTSDINLSGQTGCYIEKFEGVFDGNNFLINNYSSSQSLFRNIDNSEIRNLTLSNPYLSNGDSALLVDEMYGGVISNCRVLGGNIYTAYEGALLVGHNAGGLIIDCAAEGTVLSTNADITSTYGVGGLVAYNDGHIKRCYSSGNMTGNFWYIGGLVGLNYGTIENSYSSANIQGCHSVGGLVGCNYADILNCYCVNLVSSTCGQTVGGLVGVQDLNKAFVLNSFWDIDVSGILTSAGGTGLSTREMKNIDTYIAWGSMGWKLNNRKDYPRLIWEDADGDPIEKVPYEGGSGTQEDPYLIASAEQFYYLSLYYCDWNKYIELTNNIDFSELNDPTVCSLGYEKIPFSGNFNGNNYSVINFNVSDTDSGYDGLFRYIKGENALISNITILNPNLTLNYTSMLIGTLNQGVVDNCHVVDGTLITTAGWLGGLVSGNKSEGVIRNCSFSGNLTSSEGAGGITGSNSGELSNSYFTGNIASSDYYVGGIAAQNYGSIQNCYAQGSVSGDNYVGGLVGYCSDSTDVLLYHCYSACQVTGNLYIGAVVGRVYSSIVDRCYWDTDVSGVQVDEGAIGLTGDQMIQASSFEGWGCDPAWTIDEGNDYPRLAWEGINGELISTGAYNGGCGTEGNPYQIGTAEQLNAIGLNRNDYDKYFELNNDIEMSVIDSNSFNQIGESSYYKFSGSLDGKGFGIHNLTLGNSSHGMFYYADGATISNLTFVNPSIVSESTLVGTLCGSFIDSIANNIKVIGGTVYGGSYTGAIFGRIQTIDDISIAYNCRSECSVNGISYIGGIAGVNHGALLERCYSSGNVKATNDSGGGVVGVLRSNGAVITECISLSNVQHVGVNGGAGGIAGSVLDDVLIEKSCSKGTIEGSKRVGGLIGYVSSGDLSVKDSYSICNVSGTEGVGGLVGYFSDVYSSQLYYFDNCYAACKLTGDIKIGNFIGSGHNTTIINSCFYDFSINPALTGYGDRPDPDGLTGLSTVQLQMYNTFYNAGWDMTSESTNGTDDIWRICNGTNYPRLSWEEILTGDFLCPDGVALEDYAYLSQFWLQDCNESNSYCDGVDLDGMGFVGLDDMLIFCENWLIGVE